MAAVPQAMAPLLLGQFQISKGFFSHSKEFKSIAKTLRSGIFPGNAKV
jgi:hypothetical protein